MKPSTALHLHRARILDLAMQHGLHNVRLFGSVLYGKDTEGSDLDLLVDAPQGITLLDIIGLQQAIEDELGVRVDVLTAMDLPPSFRERVLHEAQPL
jgi:uncharacterized protein